MIRLRIIKQLSTLLAMLLLAAGNSFAVNNKLSLSDFIQLASTHDKTFEAILIEQMALQYRRDLLLPERDLVVSLKHQHNFYLDQDRSSPATQLSLSKLFPGTATDVSLSYNRLSSSTGNDTSSLELLISQPIARNAFGKSLRLADQIIGIENDILRYQVVEAYEDYLASLSNVYYNWYSAYENLQTGQASWRSNRKLLDNILERQKQNIALPVDVNKMKLSLAGKKENLVILQEIYDNLTNLVYRAIGNNSAKTYQPVAPGNPLKRIQFEQDYNAFTTSSRTYRILRLLENQQSLEVSKAADDLLPSTNLLLGYRVDGDDWAVRNQEDTVFAGIELRWPVNRSVDRAKYKIAEIEQKKTALSNQNKYEDLQVNLKNLYLQIQREEKLIEIYRNKVRLSESILRDETENYSFGKVTLNDYIDAVNRVDENRFGQVEHTVQRNKLMLEWLRLTDQLVGEEILD